MKGLRRRDIAVMVIVFSAAVWLAGMMRSFLLSEIAERLLPHVISQAAESSDGNEAQLSLKAGDTVLRIYTSPDNKLHIFRQKHQNCQEKQ